MANQDPPVGRLEKLGYGVGDLASSLYINFFNIYLLYYFVELGGVGPAAHLVGELMSSMQSEAELLAAAPASIALRRISYLHRQTPEDERRRGDAMVRREAASEPALGSVRQ